MATQVILNTGAKMPMIGLGTWKSKPGQVRAAVEAAIDAGYRHIDCAFAYGNENEIGDAIQSKIQEGKVKREDLFITTKLWLSYFRRVRECFDLSLSKLKLAYVDLYLMHWPFALEYSGPDTILPVADGKAKLDEGIHYTEVWKEMEKLQKEGLVKAIGVSNFNAFQLNRLLKDATIPPAVNQYETHPYLEQQELFDFCHSKGIVVTGYSPFGSPDRPTAKPGESSPLDDPNFKKIADKHGKTVAQVLLRFLNQLGIVVIPKSVTPSRIVSNFDIFDFELSKEEVAAIKGSNRDWRAVGFELSSHHKYYPFGENYSE